MSLLNPWPSYTEEEIASVVSVLKNGKVNYLSGDIGSLFEEEFSAFTNSATQLQLPMAH